jgi:hypothetical protein
MKKKSLLLGLAALLTFAIGFSGCESPVNTEKTIDSPPVKLVDPVVSVKAYEGFNVVSWSPVPNAASYDVWRLDTVSKTQIQLLASATHASAALQYVDDVSAGGSLVNGRIYEYIVIANSTSVSSTATFGSAKDDLYSGKGSTSVPAQVPDRLSYKVPKATDIKTAIERGQLLVSFTVPDNATATVSYTYADAALGNALLNTEADTSGTFTTTSGPGYLYPAGIAYASFPVIGGTAKIKVQTTYSGSNTSYFVSDDPAILDVPVDKYAIGLEWRTPPTTTPVTPSFTAQYLPNVTSNLTSGTVRLTFYGIKNAADYGTVTYKVYKAEVGAVANDYATAEWKPVTLSVPLDIDPVTGVVIADETVSAWTGNSIKYLVIAEVDNTGKTVQSLPKGATLASAITTPSLTINRFDDENRQVALTWDEEAGVTYTLSRATINEADQEISTYTAIPSTGAGSLAGKRRVVIDTLPKFRQSYKYRLVAEKDGIILEDVDSSSSPTTIKSEPFAKTVAGSFSAAASSTNYRGIKLTLTTTSAINSDLRATVSRAEYETNSSISSEITTWTTIKDKVPLTAATGGSTGTSTIWEDTGLTLGTQYQYRVVLTTTEQSYELTTSSFTGTTTAYPLGAPTTGFSGFSRNVGTNSYVYVSSTTGTATNNPNPEWVGVQIFKSPEYTASASSPTFVDTPVGTTVAYNNTASPTTIDESVSVPAYAYYFSVPKLTVPSSGTSYVYYGVKQTASSANISQKFSITITSAGVLGGTGF